MGLLFNNMDVKNMKRKILILICCALPILSYADDCDTYGDFAESVMEARQFKTKSKQQLMDISKRVILEEKGNVNNFKVAVAMIDKAFKTPIEKSKADKQMVIRLFSYTYWKACRSA